MNDDSHFIDALDSISEIAVSISALAAECVADAGRPEDSHLVEFLVTIRNLASLQGVIANRYGSTLHHTDTHLLAPLPAKRLQEAEGMQ
ncbi:MAG TPA: hypothetical protein DD491_03905 [Halieaceae bacterium]|nr:hypothetical protein [Halieaceae bacterium]|tara:strand:+ start:301 stop:567 length:267 start_codon:yes stop_codon:yes gene_type:complete